MSCEILPALLRAALGAPSEVVHADLSDHDWRRLESQAAESGLTAVCWASLERLAAKAPQPIADSMQQSQRSATRRRLLRETVDDVAAVFAAGQIRGVLVPTTKLLQQLFETAAQPLPEGVRLLVAARDLAAAGRQLRQIGFSAPTANEDAESVFTRYQNLSPHVILTSKLLATPHAEGLPEENSVARRARPADRLPQSLLALSPEHELLYLCMAMEAAARACGKGETEPTVPWRELFDLCRYLDRDDGEIDWADFIVETRGRGFAPSVSTALRLAEERLGIGPPLGVLQSLSSNRMATPLAGPAKASQRLEGAKWPTLSATGPDFAEPEPPTSYITADQLLHPDKLPGLRFDRLGDGRVEIVSPQHGFRIDMNQSAALLVELCDGRHSLDQIVRSLASMLDVAVPELSGAVRDAVQQLTEQGLVRPEGAPIRQGRITFPVVNQHGRWNNRPGNRHCTSKYVGWDSIGEPQPGVTHDVLFLSQFDIDNVRDHRAHKKLAWMREPRPIAWWTYESIEKYIDDFDNVLTYDMMLIEKFPGKCVYCPSGGCHINPEDFGIPAKSKLVSFIASGKRWRAPGHLARHEFYEMYGPGKRGFAKLMTDDLKIDLYGPLVDNSIEDKIESLRDYMFQIAIENIIFDTYFTEKLIDCFLTGTIPIYRGTRRVGEFFDAEGILFYSTTEELFDILRNLNEDEYQRRLQHVRRNFELAQRYTHAVDWAYEHTDVFRE